MSKSELVKLLDEIKLSEKKLDGIISRGGKLKSTEYEQFKALNSEFVSVLNNIIGLKTRVVNVIASSSESLKSQRDAKLGELNAIKSSIVSREANFKSLEKEISDKGKQLKGYLGALDKNRSKLKKYAGDFDKNMNMLLKSLGDIVKTAGKYDVIQQSLLENISVSGGGNGDVDLDNYDVYMRLDLIFDILNDIDIYYDD